MKPKYWARAAQALAANDVVMKKLIGEHKYLSTGSRGDAFQTLSRAIVGQQISVKAAQSVWDRFAAAHPGVTPQVVCASSFDKLRACGLSGQKSGYLLDLAAHFRDGRLDAAQWKSLDDETLITLLTEVKGIGRWTAEMFLIFNLARPDVFPVNDLGLQKAMTLHYNRGRKITLTKMQRIGAVWAPYRSVATWYMWRSLDPIPVEY
jgi:DNA-3-methyladenine glycosylase II